MKALYEMTLKVAVLHDVEQPLTDLKSDREMAEDICRMICDEAMTAGGVATYDIIKSSLNVS